MKMDNTQSAIFRLTKTGNIHRVKRYQEFSYPILTDEFILELKRFIENKLVSRMDKSITEDEGTCVIGAGIVIPVFQSNRHRYPTNRKILGTSFQGNLSTYRTLKPVISFLNKYYPHLRACYYDGQMN